MAAKMKNLKKFSGFVSMISAAALMVSAASMTVFADFGTEAGGVCTEDKAFLLMTDETDEDLNEDLSKSGGLSGEEMISMAFLSYESDTTLTNGSSLDAVMRKAGYSNYRVTYHYPAGAEGYHTFNVDLTIDGKSYHYDFVNGVFVKRVGPEGGGNVQNYPQGNFFTNEVYSIGSSLYYSVEQSGSQRASRDLTLSNGSSLDTVMRKAGYSNYRVTYHYPAGTEGYHTFSVDLTIDGKSYHYDFVNGVFVKRIGPENGGNVQNYPQGNFFTDEIYAIGSYMY